MSCGNGMSKSRSRLPSDSPYSILTLTWTGILLLGFLFFSVNASGKAVVRIGDPFPPLVLPDLTGFSMIIPYGVSGKVVVAHIPVPTDFITGTLYETKKQRR